MIESASPGMPLARALLRVGGVPVANHQLSLMLALECQRIVVLSRHLSPGLIALQQTAEASGAQFHVAPDARALARLVTANDELFVMADGLLPDQETARGLLDAGQVVLGQPAESGLVAGFERIDINTAGAGAMRLPGRLVDQLAELPSDCDAVSALTRIALQGGVPLREIPPDVRGKWKLIRDEDDARAVQGEWIRVAIASDEGAAPGSGLARLIVVSLGNALMQGGAGAVSAFSAALVLVLVALGFGLFGFIATGLLLCALSAVLFRTGVLLGRAELNGAFGSVGRLMAAALPIIADTAIVALIAWSPAHRPWESGFERAFAPLVLVLALRLVPRVMSGPVAAWLEDRFALALVLAAAVLTGFAIPAVQTLALAVIVAGFVFATPRSRLTGN